MFKVTTLHGYQILIYLDKYIDESKDENMMNVPLKIATTYKHVILK